MNAEQSRALVTKLENIQAGRSLVRTYTDYNTGTNRINFTESWTLGEGEIGRKIGGIFGKTGADLGDKIGDIFGGPDEPDAKKIDPALAAKSAVNKPLGSDDDAAADTGGYEKHQSGSDSTKSIDHDKYGNTASDYVPTGKLVPVTAQLSLKSPGAYADELQSMHTARGTDQRVTQSWDYRGATLALICGDRSASSEGNQGSMGIWIDPSNMALTSNDYVESLLKQHGYQLMGERTARTSNSLGNLLVNEFTARKNSKVIISTEALQMVAFTTSTGAKGVHAISAHYIGSRDIWEEQGGSAQFRQLLASMKLNGVAPMTSA